MDKRYQVFVSSTYSDLKDERSKVIQTLTEQDCIPAGMELFPAADMEQFEFIKRIIDDCDYYILIVGDDGFGPCMFTFHPGEPLRPSTLSSDGNNEFGYKEGTTISVAKAILLGFRYAKLQTTKK